MRNIGLIVEARKVLFCFGDETVLGENMHAHVQA